MPGHQGHHRADHAQHLRLRFEPRLVGRHHERPHRRRAGQHAIEKALHAGHRLAKQRSITGAQGDVRHVRADRRIPRIDGAVQFVRQVAGAVVGVVAGGAKVGRHHPDHLQLQAARAHYAAHRALGIVEQPASDAVAEHDRLAPQPHLLRFQKATPPAPAVATDPGTPRRPRTATPTPRGRGSAARRRRAGSDSPSSCRLPDPLSPCRCSGRRCWSRRRSSHPPSSGSIQYSAPPSAAKSPMIARRPMIPIAITAITEATPITMLRTVKRGAHLVVAHGVERLADTLGEAHVRFPLLGSPPAAGSRRA